MSIFAGLRVGMWVILFSRSGVPTVIMPCETFACETFA